MKWHSGPPPFVGWWMASYIESPVWRWWNGTRWSTDVGRVHTAHEAGLAANEPAIPWGTEGIKWTHYWPAGARVPRVEQGGNE